MTTLLAKSRLIIFAGVDIRHEHSGVLRYAGVLDAADAACLARNVSTSTVLEIVTPCSDHGPT